MINRPNMVSFDNEQLILVDESDTEVGTEYKQFCHQSKGLLHRAFSIFLFNEQNQVLIHKRSQQKTLWPGFWTNSCCSHPRMGESLEQATQRRLFEELGMDCPVEFLYKFIYQAEYENIGSEYELCHVYFGKTSHKPCPNQNEIAQCQWLHPDELTSSIRAYPEKYTPWLKMEWEQICNEHLLTIQNYGNVKNL